MTIGDAINALQNIVRYWDMRPTEREAAALAVQALKEKQARQNPKTNGDRIRAMTDQELAEVINDHTAGPCVFDENLRTAPLNSMCMATDCKNCTFKWLQQPAKEAQT